MKPLAPISNTARIALGVLFFVLFFAAWGYATLGGYVSKTFLASPLTMVEEGWLLRSEDSGEGWVNVRDGLDRDCHSVTFLPGETPIAIATTGQGIFRSEDCGRTFAFSASGLRHLVLNKLLLSRPTA